jgi:hypothetical protein
MTGFLEHESLLFDHSNLRLRPTVITALIPLCHTRFPEGNQMHHICVPGSSSTHMLDKMSVIS